MDLKEIEAKIAELEALKAEALKAEEEKKLQEAYDEAVILFPELVATLRRLHEIGYLPQRLADVLTDSTGKVNPGMYLKRPRAIVRPHEDAESTREPRGAPQRQDRQTEPTA
ncbi:hypothetical protein IB276_33340 [Ensifer sp. ENS04]|uniref:hypothetical protein n=1 Tax=Ensifer sp. ENS04 TaxID=2769281 RepID=UPI0017805012|nr:hypothetical protein [Ensifer sp. ENS04]MBD9544333.1 hypothetical protein [Ensifer sp. ENS04]